MRFGITILPEHRWSMAAPLWRTAESLGFDHLWTYDHLAWRSLADRPWFGTTPTLTAAATVTSHVRLGTFVASPNFRHPIAFARDLLALDDISEGRFTLGVGSGGTGWDVSMFGNDPLPPAARFERLREFVELLDLLLTEDHVTYRGEYFTAVDARTQPGCLQRPRLPFVVAANGPKAMRLAVRYGTGWATTGTGGDTVDEWWRNLAELVNRFNDVLAASERDPATVDRYLQFDAGPRFSLESAEAFADGVGRATELGFTDLVTHWPRPEDWYAGREEVLFEVAAKFLTPRA
ncbi:alkanesulfonate monooxygenase SsuD/methylene tetrahydromethanopterin reductase-like flavin-dependent oxidoreductase (luciferase family) [Crossiella equi]|uniref:Alkanesulfonate monooxygenase SsuD/methylene tetrahydromethanopterin reductase-like flavin-dependent oxidoreductase (Luciferase family) n=1 Tax=Crossiella equi TaxID=130796 RepID=A0ABS5AGD0_9PSEU|nr:LLM class flavin-dependent oxidoreductase [Crossiella equi]MBP2475407.1 alkanesulfonate monooxygenase SsuD/methylene tetrahydromethanopterin reductase-like flavin-dependent oxidoreductase (luciferase family) [Crossiella equi]